MESGGGGADTLQRRNTENLKQIFSEKEMCGPSSSFHVHVFLSVLYVPAIGLPTLLQENLWTDPGSLQYKSLTDTWMWIGTEAALSIFWEYINAIFFAVHNKKVYTNLGQIGRKKTRSN